MDVGKIHSVSSYSNLFTDVDKKDIASKNKGNDISSNKITEEYKDISNSIVDKKFISQNVSSSSASIGDTSLKNVSNNSNGNGVSRDEISSEQSFITSISPVGTRVEFSIEKELNVVVTTVKDLKNGEVIRQLPPEDTISRMKRLKSYYKQKATEGLGHKVDEIVK